MVLKTARTGIEKKFFDLCSKIAKNENLEVYDLDYIPGSRSLRVTIINRETNTACLEECVRVDKALTPYFETEDWLPETILLEVSSPGLFRQLNTIEHFRSVEGETITLNLAKKLSHEQVVGIPKSLLNNKKIMGILEETKEHGIALNIAKFSCFIAFENIKKANLESDITESE